MAKKVVGRRVLAYHCKDLNHDKFDNTVVGRPERPIRVVVVWSSPSQVCYSSFLYDRIDQCVPNVLVMKEQR